MNNSAAVVQVLFACFTRYTISSFIDTSFALIVFWIRLVVGLAERTDLTGFAIFGFLRILSFFVVWVYLYFSDLVCCFCGTTEASGAHLETFRFVRILGLFEVSVRSYFLRAETLRNFSVCSNSEFV